jgi:ribosome biogenesis GTPase
MRLEALGYTPELEKYRNDNNLGDLGIGRVVAEHRERYIVTTGDHEYEAEITGNLRFTARNRLDFPAVGDWVALMTYEAELALIHSILPRSSVITRQAVGHRGEVQVIAANIDVAFLVQAADRDFNINRLERYLAICYAAGVQPIILLTKTDLAGSPLVAELRDRLHDRQKHIPVLTLSNTTRDGYDALHAILEKGKTYCLLGSSGVGKSTLVNNLTGHQVMRTDAISQHTSKGRHVTSHRELILLEEGAMLIDNPGMREVGIADAAGGLESAFDSITGIAAQCKFKDCTHTRESGCAVIEAVDRGEISARAYENYLKMERERAHFETTVAEKRKKEKTFGKIIKDYKKINYKNK